MAESIVEKINNLLGITESYKAPSRIMEILYMEKEERDKIFMNFLNAFDKDVSYDWFNDYFQEEHADRKNQKQDFTPQSVSKLLSEIAGTGGSYYEPAAGTGSILIQRWQDDRYSHSPFDYLPSMYFYTAEELSDRAIPFLLFNTIIRGMNANIVHCDVLTREAYGVFFVQNDEDDFLGFSSLNLMPYNEDMAQEVNVNFIEKRYEPIKQTKFIPKHIMGILEEVPV